MQFKVDQNVPIPSEKWGGVAKEKYPFKELRIGDSFFVPQTGSDKEFYARMYGAGHYAKKTYSIKLTVRRVKENSVSGVRIWRIE